MFTVASGRMSVGMGFIATVATSGSPVVMPPSRPPALFDVRVKQSRSRSSTMGSCTSLPKRRATSNPIPNSTPFIAWMEKERLTQARRQAIVRRRVTAEPGNKARRHDAERAANRVALGLRALDFRNHRASRLRVRTADLARLDVERRVVHAVDEGAFLAKLSFADAIHIGKHLDAQVSQKFARDTGRRHASGGRAGARALENVAAIVGVRLQSTHQIGMPRPRRHFAHQPLRLLTEYGHAVRPVLPIAIADRERHRRADGLPETDARRNLHGVTLDGLPAAAPVARLAAGQVGVDLGIRRPADPQARPRRWR